MPGYYDAQMMEQQRKQQEAERRKQILAQNHGGHSPITGYTSNFENGGGLAGLKAMIADASPAAMQEVADNWQNVYTALDQARQQLQTHTDKALETWQGPAADQFAKRSQQLQEGLGNGAAYATHTSTAMLRAASSLTTAQTALNSIHDAGFWDHVGDKLKGQSDSQFNSDLKSGIDLNTALQLDGSQLNTEQYRFQQAVLVMQQLGHDYNSESDWLKKNQPPTKLGTPGGVYPPTGPTPRAPVGSPDTGATSPRAGGAVGAGKLTSADKARGVNDIGALSPNSGAGAGGTGTVSPVSGGTVSKLPNSPVTSVDGITGGVPVAAGTTGIGGGAGGVSGLGGLGGAGGGGLGGSSLAGLGLGAGALGAGGGLAGERLAGEGAAGEEGLAAERALAEEAAAGRGEGAGANGMMGGMGGLGRGNGRKNKRKQRAAYLVEDEETWEQAVRPNPPVIG